MRQGTVGRLIMIVKSRQLHPNHGSVTVQVPILPGRSGSIGHVECDRMIHGLAGLSLRPCHSRVLLLVDLQ